MINLKYICEIYDQYYKKNIKKPISMKLSQYFIKLSQYFIKLWTNRPLGLNTNF